MIGVHALDRRRRGAKHPQQQDQQESSHRDGAPRARRFGVGWYYYVVGIAIVVFLEACNWMRAATLLPVGSEKQLKRKVGIDSNENEIENEDKRPATKQSVDRSDTKSISDSESTTTTTTIESPARLSIGKTTTTTTTTTAPAPPITAAAAASTMTAPAGPQRTICRPTYFWAGGKAGTTSLYYLLMFGLHKDSDPDARVTPFAHHHGHGKEPCASKPWEHWVASTRNTDLCAAASASASTSTGQKQSPPFGVQRTHILNGCPRNTEKQHFGKIKKLHEANAVDMKAATDSNPITGAVYANSNANANADANDHVDPKFLMLVRDPVDRFVSHVNDNKRRGGPNGRPRPSLDLEAEAQRIIGNSNYYRSDPLEVSLSLQGRALRNLLASTRDPQSVLVIPMESLTASPQGVVDAVMDHVGGERWTLGSDASDSGVSGGAKQAKPFRKKRIVHVNNGRAFKAYDTLSANATEGLRSVFREDVLLLERLMGKRFSWSSWAHDGDGDKPADDVSGEDWIAVTPKGAATVKGWLESENEIGDPPIITVELNVPMRRYRRSSGHAKGSGA